MGTTRPARLFISYARTDAEYRRAFSSHLATFRTESLISDWYDGELVPGQEREAEIRAQLAAADIIILLLSADYFSSEYIRRVEIPHALERHHAGTARVVPVVIRAVEWGHTPLASIQALPDDGKPVKSWPDQDEAWVNVAAGIRRIVASLQCSKSAAAPGLFSGILHPSPPPLNTIASEGKKPGAVAKEPGSEKGRRHLTTHENTRTERSCGGVVAQLEFIGSSNVVERRSLTRGQTITVGRARDMDISIEDQLVSSSHAQFVADVIGLRVIDTGSKNGVFVNTVASKDVLLKAIPLTLSRPPSEKS